MINDSWEVNKVLGRGIGIRYWKVEWYDMIRIYYGCILYSQIKNEILALPCLLSREDKSQIGIRWVGVSATAQVCTSGTYAHTWLFLLHRIDSPFYE